jgi:hypothetical protein
VLAPAFEAPAQSFSAATQVGAAGQATVGISGLYHVSAEAATAGCFVAGTKLSPVYDNIYYISAIDDDYTGETVVWSGTLESKAGQGEMPRPAAQGIVDENGQYRAIFRTEEDLQFHHNYLKDCAPNWYMGPAYDIPGGNQDEPVVLTVQAPSLLRQGDAVLSVALNSNAPPAGRNTLSILVNGEQVAGEALWGGSGYRIIRVQIPAATLKVGANEISLLGDGEHSKYLDWVELEAPAVPKLQQGGLVVHAAGDGLLELTDADYAVDISEFGRERALWPVQPASSSYRLEAGRRYYFSDRVGALHFEPPKHLSLPDLGGVQYLCLAKRDLLSALDPLLAQKRQEGITAAAIAIEDVLDVYNGGMYGPEGVLRLLLQFRPQFLLIAGGFNRDSRQRLPQNAGNPHFERGVPAYLKMVEQLTVTDDPYMLDYRVKVGRIPLDGRQELEAWVAKAATFRAPEELVLLSGKTDRFNFSARHAELAEEYELAHLPSEGGEPDEVRRQLFQMMRERPHLVVYEGHAQSWELDRGLLGPAHAPSIPLSSWIFATCNAAYYFAHYEAFVRDWLGAPEGGCINALASSSVGTADQQHKLVRAFLERLREAPAEDWGSMVHYLKRNLPLKEDEMQDARMSDADKRRILKDRMTVEAYSFLGDPAARVLADPPRRREIQ